MLHRVKLSFLASWILVACTHAADPWHEDGHTFIRGRVYLDSPQAGATVELMGKDAQGGVTLPLAQTTTDIHGDWQVDTGAYEGPVQVTAQGAQISQRLDALIPWVSPGEPINTVSVTPISHIIAAYGRYLIRVGNPSDVAFSQATAQMHTLLGGIPHQSVLPQPWPQAEGKQQPVVLNDAVSSTLYLSAMDEFAQRTSRENNVQPKTVITLETLAGALAEDIEADGNFDGIGTAGRRIKLRNTPLTKDTIRTDLALALRRFSESQVHNTVLRWPEVQPLAYAVSTAGGPMFSQEARPLQLNGPTLAGCEVNSESGEKRPVTWTQKGVFSVLCQWEDAVGVAESSVSATGAPERLVPNSSYYNSKTTYFTLDSRGYEGAVFTVVLKATNNEGNTAEELLTLSLDNEPPRLELRKSAVWTNGKESAAIVVCADKELRRISSTFPESRQEKDGLCTSIIYDALPCGGAYPMSIRAEDWAGNTEDINAFLGCETEAPAIIPMQSLFRNDLDEVIMDLGEAGWGPTPAAIKKYYNKFDQTSDPDPQNLPVVKFRINLPTSYSESVPKQNYDVFYRYSYHGLDTFEGEWRSIQESNPGQFELPLSYQALLPPQYDEQLITAARLTNFVARSRFNDAHRIEFRVVDEMGNEQVKSFDFILELKSPSLYLSNCVVSRAIETTRYKDVNRLDLQHGPFFTPQVRWEVPRPSNSMAPDPEMEIVLSPLGAGHLGASKAHVWVSRVPDEKIPASLIPQARACLEAKKKTCQIPILYVDGRCACVPKVREEPDDVTFPLGRLQLDSASVKIQGSGQSVDVPIHGKIQEFFSFGQMIETPQGRLEWVFSEVLGVPLRRPIVQAAKEMVTMSTIWLQYPGLMVKPAKSQNSLPPPYKVIRDGSCQAPWGQGGALGWNADAG